jgi:hypothetical protein
LKGVSDIRGVQKIYTRKSPQASERGGKSMVGLPPIVGKLEENNNYIEAKSKSIK